MNSLDAPTQLPGDYDVEEVLADLHLACVARAIDERELTLQKQNKVFFEISGAGHEALGLGLARSLRPGQDWFFPYYRDLALVLGLGVTPEAVLLQAVGVLGELKLALTEHAQVEVVARGKSDSLLQCLVGLLELLVLAQFLSLLDELACLLGVIRPQDRHQEGQEQDPGERAAVTVHGVLLDGAPRTQGRISTSS